MTPRGPIRQRTICAQYVEAAIGRHAWRLREVAEPTVEQLRKLVPEDFDESAAAEEPPLSPRSGRHSTLRRGTSEQPAEDRPDTQGAQP